MNSNQYHLCKIAEECAEASQRAMKAQQFGLHEVQPGDNRNNLERLIEEFHDLFITMENYLNIVSPKTSVIPDIHTRKIRLAKMERYLKLSKNLNQVDEDVFV